MRLERVTELVTPLVHDQGLEIYDIEQSGATLRIRVTGPDGVPMGVIERVTRAVSFALDEADLGSGSYILEVSSPGLERPLNRPDHFAGAVGEKITLKTLPGPEGRIRFRGVLRSADEDSVRVDDPDRGEVSVPYDQIDSARTVFEWGPKPKPGGGSRRKGSSRKAAR
ncbi:MAG TPA: ribosome maturation factor RimP [Acidimicrobiales bacterium]|nr:ribosome maturation factor RimP [Acidimicrobiales bacterium]